MEQELSPVAPYAAESRCSSIRVSNTIAKIRRNYDISKFFSNFLQINS